MVSTVWNVCPPSVVTAIASEGPVSIRKYTFFESAGSTARMRGCVPLLTWKVVVVQCAPESVLAQNFAGPPLVDTEVA